MRHVSQDASHMSMSCVSQEMMASSCLTRNDCITHVNEACPTRCIAHVIWAMSHTKSLHHTCKLIVSLTHPNAKHTLENTRVYALSMYCACYVLSASQNEPCDTFEGGMPLACKACRHTGESVMSRIWMSCVSHMNESCLTYEWVMSHIWMSHGSRMKAACHTHAMRLGTQVNEPCLRYENLVPRTCNASRHTHESVNVPWHTCNESRQTHDSVNAPWHTHAISLGRRM